MKLPVCFECNGTGASQPDCWLCKGEMFISVRKAKRNGYAVEDLEDIYRGSCRCPTYECSGNTCDWCEGDGRVDPGLFEREVTRVLICAATGRIPDIPVPYYGGWSKSDYLLLSSVAGRHCRERHWIHWSTSILGDDLSLTDAGTVEFERRHPAWLAQFDSNWMPYDSAGRWADDGGKSP